MKDTKEIVNLMVNLQVKCAKHLTDSRSGPKLKSFRDLYNLLLAGKPYSKYGRAIEHLKHVMVKHGGDPAIIKEIEDCETLISNSPLKNMYFGDIGGRKYTPKEDALNSHINLQTLITHKKYWP